MSYSRSRKLTDTERRLQALRAQLYGKEPIVSQPKSSNPASFTFKSSESFSPPDTGYLKKDLLKIGVLASAIFTIQALLYLGINRGLLNF